MNGISYQVNKSVAHTVHLGKLHTCVQVHAGTQIFLFKIDERKKISLSNKPSNFLLLRLIFVLASVLVQKLCVTA